MQSSWIKHSSVDFLTVRDWLSTGRLHFLLTGSDRSEIVGILLEDAMVRSINQMIHYWHRRRWRRNGGRANKESGQGPRGDVLAPDTTVNSSVCLSHTPLYSPHVAFIAPDTKIDETHPSIQSRNNRYLERGLRHNDAILCCWSERVAWKCKPGSVDSNNNTEDNWNVEMVNIGSISKLVVSNSSDKKCVGNT